MPVTPHVKHADSRKESVLPRILPLLLAVLAVLYGGYWFFGRAGIEQAARDMLDRPGISYDSLNTIGFPSRFDTTVEGIDLQAAGGRIGWEAPFFQLFMLSYSPHKVIAVWPDRQSLRIDDTTIDISSGQMRASAQVGVSPSVPLRQATLEAETASLVNPEGGTAAIARALLAIRDAGGDGHLYDIFGELTGITGSVGMDGPAPPTAIRFEGVMSLDGPIDRNMTEVELLQIDLRDITLRWPGLTLSGRGEIARSASGGIIATGEITASDSNQLVEALQDLELVDPQGGANLSRALAAIADADGSVRVPLEYGSAGLRVAGIPVDLPALP